MVILDLVVFFFFSSRRRHTRFDCDWSSDVCSSDLLRPAGWPQRAHPAQSHGGHGPLPFRARLSGGPVPARVIGGAPDRERGGLGKRGDLRGRRNIKKKKKRERGVIGAKLCKKVIDI